MHNRSLLLVLSLALLGLLGCAVYAGGPVSPGPGYGGGPEVGVSFFYDSLAPYGEWLWVDPWGWVWTPWDVEAGWRPYTDGRWVWTDLGWTWISDEPWGWAPFHYGRWAYHQPHGWIWVPGTVWAPAWVAWRYGDGWIGWAPLPPDVRWRVGIGLDLGGIDLGLAIVQHGWCFVGERDFLDPRIGRHAEPLPRNGHLIRQTRDHTRYEPAGPRVAVRGPDPDEIGRQTGRTVDRYRIEDLGRPPRRESVQGGAVGIYRPEVRESPRAGATRTPETPEAAPGRAPETGQPAVRPPVKPESPPEQQQQPRKPRQTRPPAAPAAEAGAAPPAPTPTTEQEARRREARELENLRAWEKEQARQLSEKQQQERQRPPAGATAKEVDERQKQEQQALGKEVERERKVIENRKERRAGEEKSKPKAEPRPKPEPKPEKPPEGNERHTSDRSPNHPRGWRSGIPGRVIVLSPPESAGGVSRAG